MKANALPGLVRPFTLAAPAVGVAAGAAVATSATPASWSCLRLAAGIVAAMLATGASNAWNQAFDRDLDRVNKPGRPIPSGKATASEAVGLGCLLAVLALVLAGWVSWPFLACVGAGLAATWIYSAPPLRTKRRTVGALATIAVARGLLVPVAGWSVVTTPDQTDPWMLGAVLGLFLLGGAATKDFGDVVGDRANGCRTLPIVLGPARAAAVIAPFLVVPFLLYPLGGVLDLLHAPIGRLWVLAGCMALPGFWTARLLVSDPHGLVSRGGQHPAWVAMYVLMLGVHVGTVFVYAL